MEELQQDLSTPREPEVPLSRIECLDSQDDHASNYLIFFIKFI